MFSVPLVRNLAVFRTYGTVFRFFIFFLPILDPDGVGRANSPTLALALTIPRSVPQQMKKGSKALIWRIGGLGGDVS